MYHLYIVLHVILVENNLMFGRGYKMKAYFNKEKEH